MLPLISMKMNKAILITGGAGYIGSHTVVELVNAGYTPVIVDDFRNANRIVIRGLFEILNTNTVIKELDVCDKDALEVVFKEYDFEGIIHFAAYKAVGESVKHPLMYYRNNLIGLITLTELAVKYEVKNFVFSSSCTVYGEPKGLKEVNESTPKSEPNSPYGNTKLIGEEILIDLQKSNPDFKVVCLRYFNPVGAHPTGKIGEFPIGRPSNLLPFVTQTAIGKQEKLIVFGKDYPTKDGTCVRDYIHVCDLAKAHVKALEFMRKTPGSCLEAINIGTGKGTSVLEIIQIFEKKTGEKLNWTYGDRRPGDVSEIYANAKKANELLNWIPKYTVEDAIVHAWNWEKKLLEYA